MRKIFWIQSLLLTTAITSISYPASSLLALDSTINQGIVSLSNIISQNTIISLWNKLFGKKTGSGVSRPTFCSLWPNADDPDLYEIWSQEPVFIWKNDYEKTAEKLIIGSIDEEENWVREVDVTPEQQTWLYRQESGEEGSKKTFKPGKEYYVKINYKQVDNQGQERTYQMSSIDFKIVDDNSRREIIQGEIDDIEARNLSAEETAIQKALYFIKEGEKENDILWSDVLREVFSVQEPSEELRAVRAKIFSPEDEPSACTIK